MILGKGTQKLRAEDAAAEPEAGCSGLWRRADGGDRRPKDLRNPVKIEGALDTYLEGETIVNGYGMREVQAAADVTLCLVSAVKVKWKHEEVETD